MCIDDACLETQLDRICPAPLWFTEKSAFNVSLLSMLMTTAFVILLLQANVSTPAALGFTVQCGIGTLSSAFVAWRFSNDRKPRERRAAMAVTLCCIALATVLVGRSLEPFAPAAPASTSESPLC